MKYRVKTNIYSALMVSVILNMVLMNYWEASSRIFYLIYLGFPFYNLFYEVVNLGALYMYYYFFNVMGFRFEFTVNRIIVLMVPHLYLIYNMRSYGWVNYFYYFYTSTEWFKNPTEVIYMYARIVTLIIFLVFVDVDCSGERVRSSLRNIYKYVCKYL